MVTVKEWPIIVLNGFNKENGQIQCEKSIHKNLIKLCNSTKISLWVLP